MRSATVQTPAAIGISPPLIIDQHLDPMNIGLYVDFNSAIATTSVEFSGDDPFATYATDYNTNGIWWPVIDVTTNTAMTGLQSNAVGIPTIPCRAFRIKNTAWTGGQPSLTVVQAGGIS